MTTNLLLAIAKLLGSNATTAASSLNEKSFALNLIGAAKYSLVVIVPLVNVTENLASACRQRLKKPIITNKSRCRLFRLRPAPLILQNMMTRCGGPHTLQLAIAKS